MRIDEGATVSQWRHFFICMILLLAVLAMLGRVVFLTVIDRHFLQSQGDARTLRTLIIPAYRGMLTDRNGKPLAVSTPVASIWIDPRKFIASKPQLKKLATILGLDYPELQQHLSENRNREFIYLKRRIEPSIAHLVQALAIPGVYQLQEFKRFYPEGEIAAHVIGLTNVDDHGQEGLELAFDHYLKGIPGKKRVLKDRYGRVVEDIQNISEPNAGKDIVLSIDQRIQYLAYQELKNSIDTYHAQSGSVVVLDVKTGEILAMVNQPAFNPNSENLSADAARRNRAITDVFEPGSTMKSFSIASALDSGKYHKDSMIDTAPGWLRIDGRHVIHDLHREGVISVRTVLAKSSSVGAAKIILSLPPEQLWSLYHRLGFGESTQSGFPGERKGVLIKRKTWRPAELATLSYGYGLSVTAVQLASAYAVLANKGVRMPVTFLKRNKLPPGFRVMKPALADEMVDMLQAVVEPGGTGTKARVPGYAVAGKTGTAYIAANRGYDLHRYIGSFVGMAPVPDPRIVVAVIIRDPALNGHLGGTVAGPAFAAIMQGCLRIYNIPPDNNLLHPEANKQTKPAKPNLSEKDHT